MESAELLAAGLPGCDGVIVIPDAAHASKHDPGGPELAKGMIMALLQGKTAVITGGSTGIGLAIAKRFVEEGAYVFINGRSQAELDAAVKEIGENVTGVQGDAGKKGIATGSTPAVADTGRRLDVVFANAAVIDIARIGEVTQEHCRRRCRY